MQTITLPKRKTMRKKITATGRNGSVEGSVEVLFNHRKEDEGPGKNPKFWHIVKGKAEHFTWVSDEFPNKEDAVSFANKMEQRVRASLKEMAEAIVPKLDTVEQNLKNIGYE